MEDSKLVAIVEVKHFCQSAEASRCSLLRHLAEEMACALQEYYVHFESVFNPYL
jgi:hypothetical protein